MKRIASALVLALILGGVPIFLLLVGDMSQLVLPSSASDALKFVTQPLSGDAIAQILVIAGWAVWAHFVVCVAVETVNLKRSIPLTIPTMSVGQSIARRLLFALLATSTGVVGTTAQAAQLPEPVTVTATVADASSTSPAVTTQEHTPTLLQHKVQDGESLWSIAERHLGAGERWTEIHRLNKLADPTYPHAAVIENPDFIDAGQLLRMPENATDCQAWTTPDPESVGAEVPVTDDEPMAGDSAPADVPVESGAPESVGAEVPVTDDEPVPGDSAPADVPVESGAPESVGAEVPVTDDEPMPSDSDSAPTESAVLADMFDQESNGKTETASASLVHEGTVTAAIGISLLGGALAYGLAKLWRFKRAAQRRRRRVGEALPEPSPATKASLGHLVAASEEAAEPTESMAYALRRLTAEVLAAGSSLPKLRFVRVRGTEVQLVLQTPQEPVGAWHSDDTNKVWNRTLSVADMTDASALPASAYPALTTLGTDSDGASIYLDLETVGSLGVSGAEDDCHNVARHMAVELATSPWSDGCRVTLVGERWQSVHDALYLSHVEHVPMDVLFQRLASRVHQCEDLIPEGQRSADCRIRDNIADAFTPEVIFVGDHLSDTQRKELVALAEKAPRVGLAAITTGLEPIGTWDFNIAAGATQASLHPIDGVVLTPCVMDDETFAVVAEACAVADDAPVPGPTWAEALPSVELSTSSGTSSPTSIVVEEPTDDEPEMVLETVGTRDIEFVHDDVTLPAEEVPEWRGPIVKILGPVEICGMAGTLKETNKQAGCSSLLTFLSLKDAPVTVEHVADQVRGRKGQWSLSTARRNISLLRTWLGHDEAGEPYLPHIGSDRTLSLHGVPTDYHDFVELVGEDASVTPSPRLWAALKLVRGVPFAGQTFDVSFYDALDLRVHDAIVDVCHELARRCLVAKEYQLARQPLAMGRQIDPTNMALMRMSIVAAHRLHDDSTQRALCDEVKALYDDLGEDVDNETADLLDRVAPRWNAA